MKREIKFDIVLKHKKDNDIIHEVFTYTEIFNGDAKLKVSYLNEDGYIVIANRMFTGLQDKNGKDIFEGDIVVSTCNKMKPKKDETDLFETPEFELKTFHNVIDWFNGVRISGWRIKGKGFQTQLKWSTVGNMNLEVIGNIYDNPELLK